MRHLHGGHDDQRRQAVGQQVAQHLARPRQAQHARGLHVLLVALHQCAGPHGARIQRPLDGHERDDHLVQALAEDGQQDQRQQDGGKGQLQVDDAHHQRINPAAEVGGHQPQHQAQGQGRHGAEGAHPKRGAQAVKNAREHVASLVVRAEQEAAPGGRGLARRQLGIQDVQLRQVVGVLRRNPGRQQRQRHHRQQQHQAGQRRARARVLAPQAPRRALGAFELHVRDGAHGATLRAGRGEKISRERPGALTLQPLAGHPSARAGPARCRAGPPPG